MSLVGSAGSTCSADKLLECILIYLDGCTFNVLLFENAYLVSVVLLGEINIVAARSSCISSSSHCQVLEFMLTLGDPVLG